MHGLGLTSTNSHLETNMLNISKRSSPNIQIACSCGLILLCSRRLRRKFAYHVRYCIPTVATSTISLELLHHGPSLDPISEWRQMQERWTATKGSLWPPPTSLYAFVCLDSIDLLEMDAVFVSDIDGSAFNSTGSTARFDLLVHPLAPDKLDSAETMARFPI
jgi:hypothetical protein